MSHMCQNGTVARAIGSGWKQMKVNESGGVVAWRRAGLNDGTINIETSTPSENDNSNIINNSGYLI